MTLIEMLAAKKKGAVTPPETAVVLPMIPREHEGNCGESCGCGRSDEGGCCGG